MDREGEGEGSLWVAGGGKDVALSGLALPLFNDPSHAWAGLSYSSPLGRGPEVGGGGGLPEARFGDGYD
jgi:hypothetical protein